MVIKSRHFVGVQGGNVSIRARRPAGWSAQSDGSGIICLDAGDQIQWQAENNSYYGSFGATIEASLSRTRVSLGGTTSVIDGQLWVSGDVFYRRFRRIQNNPVRADYRTTNNQARLKAVIDAMQDFANHPLHLGDGFAAKWLKSNQYNISSTQTFLLPEPEWQHRAAEKLDANSSILNAGMYDNQVDGTAPFPGAEAWQGNSMGRSSYSTPDFGEEPTVDLTVEPTQPAGGRKSRAYNRPPDRGRGLQQRRGPAGRNGPALR